MKKILRTTIICLLIPSLLFAQIPQHRANESSVKQTDLAQVLNALNTEVGQQIVSYIETTVGSIDLEHAKAFITAKGEVAFVPIKSFSRVLVALCYRQLEDGSEYLFLITYDAIQKGVSFTFPSGQKYVMKSSGVKESVNSDFQFQEYDDLSNNVGITANEVINLVCFPILAYVGFIGIIFTRIFPQCFCSNPHGCGPPPFYCNYLLLPIAAASVFLVPLLLIVPAYSSHNSKLEITSILFAVYYYGCILGGILTTP